MDHGSFSGICVGSRLLKKVFFSVCFALLFGFSCSHLLNLCCARGSWWLCCIVALVGQGCSGDSGRGGGGVWLSGVVLHVQVVALRVTLPGPVG